MPETTNYIQILEQYKHEGVQSLECKNIQAPVLLTV